LCLINEVSGWEPKQDEFTNHTTGEDRLQVTRTITKYNEDYSLLVSKTVYPSKNAYTLITAFNQLRYLGLVTIKISTDIGKS